MTQLIKTPMGLKKYGGIRKMRYASYYVCTFSNGKTIKCSPNHPFMTYDGIILAKDLTKRSEIYGENGGLFLKSKRNIKKEVWLYDALNSEVDTYYTNGILSHNCSFLGSANTLVSGTKLSTLTWIDPIKRIAECLDIYEEPKPNHVYIISVDTSEGQNLDYSAFTVIDASEVPYKIVAKYYNNKISPMVYPSVIYNTALRYNSAHCLIESNSIGSQVVDLLHKDLEYENVFSTTNMGRGGQRISAGFRKNAKLGIKMTTQIKSIGCANLKELIETNKLIIQDYNIITELTSFVSNYTTYSAEPGCHDDLVMSLVMFSWLTTQAPFKEITNINVRAKIAEEKIENMQEEVLPFGYINDSYQPERTVDSEGNVWEEVTSEELDYYNLDKYFWQKYK